MDFVLQTYISNNNRSNKDRNKDSNKDYNYLKSFKIVQRYSFQKR